MNTHKSKYIKKQLQKKMVEEIAKDYSKQSKLKSILQGFLIWGSVFLIFFLIIRWDVHIELPSYFTALIILLFIVLICIYLWFWNRSTKKKYLKEIERSYYENQHEYSSHQNESPEEDERFSEINKHYIKASKFTYWDWVIIIPIGVLCVWFLINKNTDFNIPELNSSNRVLFLLLSVFSFGLLMSIMNSAKKGQVGVYLGRSEWIIKKEKNPKLFFFIISVYLIAVFTFCVYMTYRALS